MNRSSSVAPLWGSALALWLLAVPAARAEEPAAGDAAPDDVVVRVRHGELPQAPAAAATVVDAARFAGEAKGVAELLAVSPGVDVQRYGAPGQLATVAIRGVAADGVKVLLDGLPLGAAGGQIDLSTIPRAWIGRVQVIRGPAGAAFGAGALGGAVNVVTRDASGVSAEASGGSFGTFALSGDAGGRAGAFSVLGGVTIEGTRGDFPYLWDRTPDTHGDPLERRVARNDASRRGGVLVKLGGPAGVYRLDALVQVSGGHRELPTPSSETPPEDWQDDGRALAMLRLARDLGDSLSVSARAHGRADLLDTRIAGMGGVARQRGGAGGLELGAGLALGAARLDATAAAEEERWSGTALGSTRDRFGLSAALSADVPLGARLRVAPAVRVERTGRFSGVSGNLGARVELPGDLRVRVSAGRTYRVPSFAELYLRQGALEPNPDLRPARGLAADAELAYDGPPGLVSVGAFVQREDDIITYEPASLDRFRPQNTQAALLRGLEVELATVPWRAAWNLSIQGAATLLRSEVVEGPPGVVGHDLPRRPRRQLYARVSAAPGPFALHVELRGTEDQAQDRYGLRPLPDAAVWGGGGSVRLSRAPRISLHLQLDNVTDRRDLLDGFGNPLPGRTVMVTVRAATSHKDEP